MIARDERYIQMENGKFFSTGNHPVEMPGQLKWLVGENLQKLGVKILNSDITGKVHKDRKLLTSDNPLASPQPQ